MEIKKLSFKGPWLKMIRIGLILYGKGNKDNL